MARIEDCSGKEITIGKTIKRLDDDKIVGEVVDIILPETHKTRPSFLPMYYGDLVIETPSFGKVISSNYSNWKIVS